MFGAVGMLMVYTGLMLSIVWKSFDMTAELKNWVFEWIGGSPRSMGENQLQQQHIMGAVNGAQRAGKDAASSSAHKPKPQGGMEDSMQKLLDKNGLGNGGGSKKEEPNSQPKETA